MRELLRRRPEFRCEIMGIMAETLAVKGELEMLKEYRRWLEGELERVNERIRRLGGE